MSVELKPNRPTLVLFRMDGCYYCEQLKPTWNDVAATLRDLKLAHIQEFEANEHSEIMHRYGIQGYPTIMLFKNGGHEKFTGERTPERLIKFVTDGN